MLSLEKNFISTYLNRRKPVDTQLLEILGYSEGRWIRTCQHQVLRRSSEERKRPTNPRPRDPVPSTNRQLK